MNPIIELGLGIIADKNKLYKTKKAELKLMWEVSKLMPRKKKKQARKEIQLDWRINEWLGSVSSYEVIL